MDDSTGSFGIAFFSIALNGTITAGSVKIVRLTRPTITLDVDANSNGPVRLGWLLGRLLRSGCWRCSYPEEAQVIGC